MKKHVSNAEHGQGREDTEKVCHILKECVIYFSIKSI